MSTEPELIDVELKEPEKKTDPEIEIKELPETKVEKVEKKDPVPPEEGLKKLQENLQKEKQARINAEYREKQQAARADTLENEVGKSQLSQIDSAIEFAKDKRTDLRARYSAALQAGDFDAAGEINEAIADLSAELLNLKNGKVALAEKPKPRTVVESDPVEAFAKNLQAPAANWVRNHPEYVTDPRLNKKMIAAHGLAVADEVKEGSPEYFAHIEKTLGIANEPEEEDASSEAAQPVKRRSSPAAAPVSRSMDSSGKKLNVVTLSREEVEMAEMMGQTKEEYARNKQKLVAEGRLGRTN